MENIVLQKTSDDYLLRKQIELMMEASNKKIAAELSKINEMIERLSKEIFDVKRQLNEVTKTGSMVISEKNVRQEPIRQETQPRPRYGDYKSEDVSVDKLFYYGNKR